MAQGGRRFALCLVASAFVGPGSASGARDPDVDTPSPPAGSGGWIVTLGGTASFEPRFVGGSGLRPTGLPLIDARRVGEADRFSSPEDGLDYPLIESEAIQAGPVANLRSPRYASLARSLTGLRSHPYGLDAGAFAQVWLVPDAARLRIELRQSLRHRDGMIADVFADGIERLGPLTVSTGPRLSIGDATTNRFDFGVSTRESSLNGAPAYRPSAGLRSVGWGSAVSYDWSSEWRTTLYGRYDRLVSEVAASPVTRRYGSPDQGTVGIGLYYSFRTDVFD